MFCPKDNNMKSVGKVLLTGVVCATVGASCSREPFMMVDVDNLWQDKYGNLEEDSTFWSQCKTYNVQDPSVRLIDDTFYLFSSDYKYVDLAALRSSNSGNNRNNRDDRGGGRGGFPGFPGFPGGFSQENSRAQKSKDRVVVKREERMKMRAAALGEDTTTVLDSEQDTVQMPEWGGMMAGPGMRGGFGPGMRGGDTTGMAARRAAMAARMGRDSVRGENRPEAGSRGGRGSAPAMGGAPAGGGFGPGMGGGFPGMGGEGGFAGFPGMRGRRGASQGVGDGFIQRRKSVDLYNWEFAGWVLDSMPSSASDWMKGIMGPPVNTTKAPFVMEYKGVVRIYYTLSAIGRGPSFIGLIESESVYGPWEDKGAVLTSDFDSEAVATSPTVIEHDGKMYMYYGAAPQGVYCVELNPATGKPVAEGSYGTSVAKGMEAPEVVYNDEHEMFYLFCSAVDRESLNVRVGRSKSPMGPFTDYEGNSVNGNSLPEVMNPYTFDKHVGWRGIGQISVFEDGGEWYVSHNAETNSDARMMTLHLRKMIFTEDGWPLVMPERFAGEKRFRFITDEVCGGYEILRFNGNDSIPCKYLNIEAVESDWSFDESAQVLNLTLWNGEVLNGMMPFLGHDWERQSTTIQFVGIDEKGHTVWGKRVD